MPFSQSILHPPLRCSCPRPGGCRVLGVEVLRLASVEGCGKVSRPLLPLLVTDDGHLGDLLVVVVPEFEVRTPGAF